LNKSRQSRTSYDSSQKLQAAFDAVLEQTHPMSLAWDRIHPTTVGHMIIAKAFLKAFEAI
jgi:phospholipase/lecithinase/hemolysin